MDSYWNDWISPEIAIYLQQNRKHQSIWVHENIQAQAQHGEYHHTQKVADH